MPGPLVSLSPQRRRRPAVWQTSGVIGGSPIPLWLGEPMT